MNYGKHICHIHIIQVTKETQNSSHQIVTFFLNVRQWATESESHIKWGLGQAQGYPSAVEKLCALESCGLQSTPYQDKGTDFWIPTNVQVLAQAIHNNTLAPERAKLIL